MSKVKRVEVFSDTLKTVSLPHSEHFLGDAQSKNSIKFVDGKASVHPSVAEALVENYGRLVRYDPNQRGTAIEESVAT